MWEKLTLCNIGSLIFKKMYIGKYLFISFTLVRSQAALMPYVFAYFYIDVYSECEDISWTVGSKKCV